MDELTYHLTYLTKLLQPPTTYGWWLQVEHRAKELAEDPALAQLPALVRQEYERLRSVSRATATNAEDAANTSIAPLPLTSTAQESTAKTAAASRRKK